MRAPIERMQPSHTASTIISHISIFALELVCMYVFVMHLYIVEGRRADEQNTVTAVTYSIHTMCYIQFRHFRRFRMMVRSLQVQVHSYICSIQDKDHGDEARQEITILEQVKHANIVQLLDAWRFDKN